jgi:hypothetical protein
MAKTWSNSKNTDTRSAAERLREKPPVPIAFIIGVVMVVLFFFCMVTYATVRATSSPTPERTTPEAAPPKGG